MVLTDVTEKVRVWSEAFAEVEELSEEEQEFQVVEEELVERVEAET